MIFSHRNHGAIITLSIANWNYRQTEFARRMRVELPGFQVWLVSREDLILSKLAWARDSESELQMRDVRNLLSSEVDMA